MLEMSWRKVFLFLLLIYESLSGNGTSANGEELIARAARDFLHSFREPYALNALACTKFEFFQFQKEMANKGVQFMVKTPPFRQILPIFTYSPIVFLISLQCNYSREIFVQANEQKLFASPYKWLILSNNNEDFSQYFRNISTLIDSSVTIITNNGGCFNLMQIHKYRQRFELITDLIGKWCENTGLLLLETREFWLRKRRNLNGTTLGTSIVITNNDTLKHLTDEREKHIDTITKVNYILVEHLKDIINATYNYTIQSTWGYEGNHSQWSGMIGDLQRLKSDIGGTPLFLTPGRVRLIDYLQMTTPTRSKFVFRQPKLSYVANVYLLPFHWSVWVCSITLIIVTALALFVAMRWEWRKNRIIHKKEKNQDELRDSFPEIMMLALGAACQQGSASVPYSIPGRIVVIVLFVSVMALFTSYSANIVALLQSSSNSIRTLNDLLHSRLELGVDDTVFNRFYFPNASEPIRRAIYLQKVAPPGQREKYFSIADGVGKMREGLFAFHMETGAGYEIVVATFEEHEKCDLAEIQFLQVEDPWLAVQKNTSFKEMFKIGLKQIHERGLQNRQVWQLYTKKPPCISRGSSFISVGIIDCYFAASMFLGGVIFSLGIFILEKMLFLTKKSVKCREHFRVPRLHLRRK